MNKEELDALSEANEWGKIVAQLSYNDPAMLALAMFRMRKDKLEENEDAHGDREV
jgi:hypothetical protein